MDPVTLSLTIAAGIISLANKVWDATPLDIQKETAGDWGRFLHQVANLGQPAIPTNSK